MSVSKDLKSGEVSQNVDNILKDVPWTRDSDKTLILQYMVRHEGLTNIFTRQQIISLNKVFSEMPSFETITRARRKIQSEGRFLASADVKEERDNEESEVREHFRGK